jgi:enamine deaminase RidA (YjgF/YER057c/UK114 family)
MTATPRNPVSIYPPYRNYSHAQELSGDQRLLFISGLNGYERDGKTMPESFDGQATNIWTYMGEILTDAGMSYDNLVSIRFYLSDPAYRTENTELRARFLGHHNPAITVIACTLLDPTWKLEIEAVAAD